MTNKAKTIKQDMMSKNLNGKLMKHPRRMFFSFQGVMFFLANAKNASGIYLHCDFLALMKQAFAISRAQKDAASQYKIITESHMQKKLIVNNFKQIIDLMIQFFKKRINPQNPSETRKKLILSNINLMSISQGLSNKILQIFSDYPFTSTSIAIFSLAILFLRKFHGKFVVYPEVGGRHNNQNPYGYRHPREKLLNSEDVQIESQKDIKLRGWYIKHADPQKLIIYFHQNTGNIGGRLYYSKKIINESKVNVLLVAYRGFSDSDGNWKPSESEIMKDAVAVFRKGVQLAKRDKLPLFVFGRSLGGAAAIHTLSRQQFKYSAKGLIIQNTFTSICDVAYNFLPPLFYPLRIVIWLATFGSYRSISKIKNIHAPILFIKGRRDTLVPSKLMDALQSQFSLYKGQHFTLEVEKGAHNNTWCMAGEKYFEAINQFMNNCLKI